MSCQELARASGMEWVSDGAERHGTDADQLRLRVVERGEYEHRGMIASGGMGRITRAHDRRLNREVAIKEVLSDAYRARFEREALITARLQHPAIVPIYEAGEWPSGAAFYTMRLVSGVTLGDAIDGATSFQDRLALVSHLVAVTDAVAFAHSKRIIHRDLKPLNVLVGEFGETVVIDWGLARVVSGEEHEDQRPAAEAPAEQGLHAGLTQAGAVLGTPCFMAPEQAAGEEADERTDVYALGAMLYTVLVGKRPYSDTHDGVIAGVLIDAVLKEPPTPILELEPRAPADLVAIAERAMAPGRTDRWRDAQEMAGELHRFQAGQLLTSRTYGVRELLARWVRRHRAAVTVAAVAAAVVIGGGIWSVTRIATSRDSERDARVVAERAKGVADQRNHELIYRQAASALRFDPTATIAWLREYPEDGPLRVGAGLLAAEAKRSGVATHVFAAPSTYAERLLFVPEHDLLVVTTSMSTARAWRLRTGEVRELSTFNREEVFYDAQTKRLLSPMQGILGFKSVALEGTGETTRTRLPEKGADADWEVVFDEKNRRVAAAIDRNSELDDIAIWELDDTNVSKLGINGVPLGFAQAGASLLIDLWDENVFKLIDLASGATLATYAPGDGARTSGHRFALHGRDGIVFALAPSKEKKQPGQGVRLFRGTEPQPTTLHDGRVATAVRFTDDGAELVAGFDDGLVSIIDVGTATVRCDWRAGTAITAVTVARVAGEMRVAAGGADGGVTVAHRCGENARHLLGHRGEINVLAFSPDGKRIATSAADQEVRVYELGDSEAVEVSKRSASGCSEATESKRRGAWMWTNCFDPAPSQWIAENVETKSRVTYAVETNGWLSGDGSTFVGRAANKKALILSGGKTRPFSVGTPNGSGVIHDGSLFFVPTTKAIEVWNLERLELERAIQVRVKSVRPSPDGSAMLVDNQLGIAVLAADGTLEAQGATHLIYPDASWSADSQVVAAQTGDSSVTVFDRRTKQWRQINTPEMIHSVALSPSGERVAAQLPRTYVLWDLPSDARFSVPFDGEESLDGIHFEDELTVYGYSTVDEMRVAFPPFSHSALDGLTRAVIRAGRASSPNR